MLSMNWTEKNLSRNAIIALIMALAGVCAVIRTASHTESADATDPNEVFYTANVACKAGDYDKAIHGYENIINGGFKSGELYYNIANCYLEKRDIGRAILNYKRAMRFTPRDSALLINYGYALSKMKQRDTSRKEPYLIVKLREALDFFTIKEAIFIFLGFYYLAAIVMIVRKLDRTGRSFLWLINIILVLAVIAVATPLAKKINEAETEMIITSKTTDAKLEPLNDAPSSFPLYEGMKVYVVKSRKDWHKIKRPDGRIGWVAALDLDRVSI